MSKKQAARDANTNQRPPYDPNASACGDLAPAMVVTRPGAMDAYRLPSLVNGERVPYTGISSFGSDVKRNEVIYGIYGFDVDANSRLANKAH